MHLLSKGKAKVVLESVKALHSDGVIDDATLEKIQSHIKPASFDWLRLARYSFILAILCAVIAIGAAIADEWIRRIFSIFFDMSALSHSAFLAVLAAGIFYVGLNVRARKPGDVFRAEAIFFFGVLAIAGSVLCLGGSNILGSHFSIAALLTCIIYGLIGFALRSSLIWCFSLLSLGGWFGMETGYASGWGAYYLGMEYPLRFVVFGFVLILCTLAMRYFERFALFFPITRVVGMLYFFIAFWILSIFGNNHGDSDWRTPGEGELFIWSIGFGVAAAIAIYFGLRNDDGVLRGFGLTFLGINLYTRFFEYFWNGMNKAVFFIILAVSFWFLGTHAEKIWQMRPLRKVFAKI